MDPADALHRMHGAARRNELLRMGVTSASLRAAVARGEVGVPHFGTYVLPGADHQFVMAAALRGQVTCLSACEMWGISVPKRARVAHIAVPADRHVLRERLDRARLHGVHRVPECDPSRLLASPIQAIDAAALCLSPLGQLILIDSALDKGLIKLSDLAKLRLGSRKRRQWLVRNARLGVQAVSETVARAALQAAGMRPSIQVDRPRAGRVDIAVGTRHVVEVDGYTHHSSKRAFREDRRRDREIAADRDWSLRFTYEDVMDDPREFVATVSRVTRIPIHKRFDGRMTWMLRRPRGHLDRVWVETVRPPRNSQPEFAPN